MKQKHLFKRVIWKYCSYSESTKKKNKTKKKQKKTFRKVAGWQLVNLLTITPQGFFGNFPKFQRSYFGEHPWSEVDSEETGFFDVLSFAITLELFKTNYHFELIFDVSSLFTLLDHILLMKFTLSSTFFYRNMEQYRIYYLFSSCGKII